MEARLKVIVNESKNMRHDLIRMKSNGYLIFPSESILDICIYAEKMFRASVCGNISNIVNHFICEKVVIFSELDNHMTNCHPLTKHIEYLIKSTIECYLKVRFHYTARHFTEIKRRIVKHQSRQQATKLMLFNGQ